MNVSVVFVGSLAHAWIDLDVEESCSVGDAIEQSGILAQFPEIDLAHMKVGIYGKFTRPDAPLSNGDRIEIYRPITRVLDEDDEDEDD